MSAFVFALAASASIPALAASLTLRPAPGPDEPPGPPPLCVVEGIAVYADGPVDPDEVAARCDEIRRNPPRLPPALRVAPPPEPPWRTPPVGLLAAAAVAVAGLLGGGLARHRAALGWTVIAAFVRAVASPPGVLMGLAYPSDKLLTYAGERGASYVYGGGFAAVAAVARPVLGDAPERLHDLNRLLSSLTVGALVLALRHAPRVVGHTAGLLAATAPLALGLAGTETEYVLVALLVVAALAGLSGGGASGHALAALAAGLLGHTRPFELGFAGLVALVLLGRRAWIGAAVAIGLVGLRAHALAGLVAAEGWPSGAGKWSGWTPLRDAWTGPWSPWIVTSPTLAPAFVLPLAVAGAAIAARRWPRDLSAVWIVGLAALVVPYLHMDRPTDVLRFGLPAAALWLGLAATTAVWWRERPWPVRGVALAGAVATSGLTPPPPAPRFTHQLEHNALLAAARALPTGSVVRYDDRHDAHGGTAAWLRRSTGVRLVPWRAGPAAPGERMWRGLADANAAPPCEVVIDPPLRVPARTGGLVDVADGTTVALGLARCR